MGGIVRRPIAVGLPCVLGVLLLLGAGCGRSKSVTVENSADTALEAQDELGEAISSLGAVDLFTTESKLDQLQEAQEKFQKAIQLRSRIVPVDYGDLKGLLPDRAGGMRRVSAKGRKEKLTSVFGDNYSLSEATGEYNTLDDESSYDDESHDKSVTIVISDSPVTVLQTLLNWKRESRESEGDEGYERKTDYKGHKALESFENEGEEGLIEVLVAGRFSISVNTFGLPASALTESLDKIDFDTLLSLEEQGISE